jgi:hypothetical protein
MRDNERRRPIFREGALDAAADVRRFPCWNRSGALAFVTCRLSLWPPPREPVNMRLMGEARAQVAGFSFLAMREKPAEGEAVH